MKKSNLIQKIKQTINTLTVSKPEYKALKAHLNRQPVGYPSTLTGVEDRLLSEIFTPSEATTALYLTSHFEPLEMIHQRMQKAGKILAQPDLATRLQGMEKRGAIFIRYRNGIAQYALHPFVVGMYEMQLDRLTPGYYMDTLKYAIQGFGMEYLSTAKPQMRTIPIQKSISTQHNIATYDEIRCLVKNGAHNLRLVPCICKKGRDLIDEPCKKTKRRDVCLLFNDFAEMAGRRDWGTQVSEAEALEMLTAGEKEGLMLMASNMQEPQVVCSCCGCCCGITGIISSVPRPADFAAGNFVAHFDPQRCNGCQRCIKRCNMKALLLDQATRKPTGINPAKCIGCGVCIPTCKPHALTLHPKATTTEPPQNHDELMAMIAKGKKSFLGKAVHITKTMMGIKRPAK